MSTTPTFAPHSAPEPVGETSSAEDLQRAYIWSINSAIESGGDGLADELADGYRRESRLLSKIGFERSAA
jgi:hypothetical protein